MRSFSSPVSQWSRGIQALCSLTWPKRCFQSWNLLAPMPSQRWKCDQPGRQSWRSSRGRNRRWRRGCRAAPSGPSDLPKLFFSTVCVFQEFGHDLIFASELGFEPLDLLVLRVLDRLGLAAVVEGGMAVLEELFEPAVDLVGVKIEFIAEVRDGNLVDEVPLEDGDLLGAGKMTTRSCS